MCCEAPLRLCVKRYLQARTGLKGPPLSIFFSALCDFFRNFFNVPKGFPLWVFCYFATECVFINQKGSPFYIFGTTRHFPKENFFSKISSFFPKKMFCAFWALDIAPTWDVPVLFNPLARRTFNSVVAWRVVGNLGQRVSVLKNTPAVGTISHSLTIVWNSEICEIHHGENEHVACIVFSENRDVPWSCVSIEVPGASVYPEQYCILNNMLPAWCPVCWPNKPTSYNASRWTQVRLREHFESYGVSSSGRRRQSWVIVPYIRCLNLIHSTSRICNRTWIVKMSLNSKRLCSEWAN